MSEATNLPNIGNSSLPEPTKPQSSNTTSLAELTDKNWLFIKHFLETSDLQLAYNKAGYDGTTKSAPYELFRRLKPYIEEIVNTELTSKLKFNKDLNKALSIPLVDKEHLTVSEWLRLRKFASSLVPEMQENKQSLSVLVVNRFATQDEVDKANGGLDNKPTYQSPDKDVNPTIIDATILPEG